jgi:hypothetical protein
VDRRRENSRKAEGHMAQVAEKAPFVYDASLEDQGADPAREAPEPGTVVGVLCDVVPLGWEVQEPFPGDKNGKSKEVFKLELYWQIEEMNSKGYRFTPRRRMTLSLNEKATFAKFYSVLVGRPLTEAEATGKAKVTPKSLFPLIGTSVLLNLVRTPKGYTNVDSISALPKGLAGLEIENFTRVKDRN